MLGNPPLFLSLTFARLRFLTAAQSAYLRGIQGRRFPLFGNGLSVDAFY